MSKSRKIIYSLLALPLLLALVTLGMIDSSTRRGFLSDYGKALSRLFAGEWSLDELSDPVPHTTDAPHNRRGRPQFNGYGGYNAATISAKLDKNTDGKLDATELGRHLASVLEPKMENVGELTLKQFEDSFNRWSPPPDEVATQTGQAPEKLTAENLLDPNHVVRVEITIAENDWQQLCNQTRDHRSATQNPLLKPYTNFRGSVVVDGVSIPDVAIRKKGFIGSQDTTRPSLKIKFDEYVDQDPVEGLDRLTLNNNKQDRALVSQSLTYTLFRKAGVLAPRSTFAHVTVNGRYLGIYTHVESVKKPFLRHAFGDDTSSIYEGTLTDIYPPALPWLEAKTKRSETNRKALTELAVVLDTDSTTLTDIAERVDVDNYLTYWAIENLINFWDGYCQNQNNYFICENPANGLMYFVPWGADSCFGQRPRFVQRNGEHAESVRTNGILANKLFHLPEIPEQYRQTMRRVLDEVWNEDELLAEVDRIEALLLDHLNFHQIHSIIQSDSVRDFIRGRRQMIESELENNWPPQVSDDPRIPRHDVEVGTGSGSFQIKNDSDEYTVTGSMTLQDETVTFDSIAVEEFAVTVSGNAGDWPIHLQLRMDNGDPVRDGNSPPGLSVTGEFSNRQRGISVHGSLTPLATDIDTNLWTEGKFEFTITETRGGFMDRQR